jgi:tRNA(Ile)-lysidine synthase
MSRNAPESLHPLEKHTLDYIGQYSLFGTGARILVGVSGGPDSTALLSVLVSLEKVLGISEITVVHFDHQLRGEDSRADSEFVAALAQRHRLPFYRGTEDVQSFRCLHKISLEMAARACRHRFFGEALDRFKADVVALGHTSNDQAEEMLLRLIRGTGPSGLAAMLPKTSTGIIRPLLHATRREILEYLDDAGVAYRSDSSNDEPFCLRNLLRLEVLPLLEKKFNPKVVENLSRHARLVLDDEVHWGTEIQRVWPSLCIVDTPSRIALRLATVCELPLAVQRRLFRSCIERLENHLQGIYAIHVESILRWIGKSAPGSSIELPRGLIVTRDGEALVFSKGARHERETTFTPCPCTISAPGRYAFSTFILRISLAEVDAIRSHQPASPDSAWLDADKVHWPLVVRSWRPGDRFRPLGLHGTKKLQDYFVDGKIPRHKRSAIPLLCDQEKICCVIGSRPDDRAKITDGTKVALIVEMERVDADWSPELESPSSSLRLT